MIMCEDEKRWAEKIEKTTDAKKEDAAAEEPEKDGRADTVDA